MSFIGAALLAFILQPTGETSAPMETAPLAREYDVQLNLVLTALIGSAETGPDGEIVLTYPLGDPRFLKPNSGHYWQISAMGQEVFASRSLWDRRLNVSGRKAWVEPLYYNSSQFPNEPLRVAERTVYLPNSDVEWQFVVARSHDEAD